MERSSKRGKIPQSDWPLIMARYEAGETLASIARTYDCSPPAISYVVSRSRNRHSDSPPPMSPNIAEAQLVKSAATEGANGSARALEPAVAPASTQTEAAALTKGPSHPRAPQPQPVMQGASRDLNAPHPANGSLPHSGNGDAPSAASERHAAMPGGGPLRATAPVLAHGAPGPAAPAGAVNGDQRRTLHLSLGQSATGNGIVHPTESQAAERSEPGGIGQQPQPAAPPDRLAPPANAGSAHDGGAGARNAAATGFSEMRSAGYQAVPRQGEAEPEQRRATGTFIDQQLRARVDGDIAAFLAAFDAALLQDTQESRSALREATDRLLRAGARTRIELERLEARIPLPPRDNGGRGEPAWRHR